MGDESNEIDTFLYNLSLLLLQSMLQLIKGNFEMDNDHW